MVELSKKLGKLSLAILENFVEGVLGEKFVDELRLTTDRAIAIGTALGEVEELFLSTYGDEDLSRALFVDFSQDDRPELKNAVGRYFDHPTDPSLRQSLQTILFDEFKSSLAKDEIDKAVDFYLKLLTKELMLADEAFRDNVAALAQYEGNLADHQSKELLEQIAAQIMTWQNASQNVFRSLHQLPPVPSDFTGRDDIIQQLLNDINLQKGSTTSGLVGMGGIGKTMLGLAVAHKVATSYPDAQIFLDLKGTTTSLSSLDIARHVILAFEPTVDLRTMSEANIFGTYHSVLHGKKVLLFFDNARSAEQIRPVRPPETCAMLITSRWVFTVPGINNRRVAVMSQNDAQKFLLKLSPRIGDKANELAAACSYLPLALRIAGSFLQVNSDWPIEKYLDQLSDRKQRLITLKESHYETELATESDLITTFELSYSQLTEEYRKYWRVLGVFPTSFDLNAAQNVWELGEIETAKLLSLLRRYSLIDYDESSYRYYLHDLLAAYALEQMNSDEKTAAQVAHSLHYSKLLTSINDLFLRGGESIAQSLNIYDTEWTNFDVGQRVSAEHLDNNPDAVLSCNNYALQGSINGLRQEINDRIRWLEDGLRASKILGNVDFIGDHLNNLGVVYSDLGQSSKAINFYMQKLSIAHETGDRKDEGGAWGNIGVAYLDLGDLERSAEFLERALEIAHETEDRLNESNWLENLGNIQVKLGNHKKAIEFYEQDLNITREIGNLQGESSVLGNLGAIYEEIGETSRAVEFHSKSMELARKIGDRHNESRALGNLGVLHAKSGDFRKALDFFKQHYEIAHEIGKRLSEAKALENLAATFTELGEFSKSIDAYEQASAINRETGNRKAELMNLRRLGQAYAMIGTIDLAARAIDVNERQLVLARELKDSDAEAAALGMLGFLSYNIGETEKGIMLTKQALGLFESSGAPASAADATRRLLEQWGVEGQRKKRRKRKRKG